MIILDTNVLSELMRPTSSPRVVAWVAKQPAAQLFTTSITEAEIFYRLELLTKGKRRKGLLAAAEAMFAEDLADRVLGFNSDAARAFSKIAAHRRALGKVAIQRLRSLRAGFVGTGFLGSGAAPGRRRNRVGPGQRRRSGHC